MNIGDIISNIINLTTNIMFRIIWFIQILLSILIMSFHIYTFKPVSFKLTQNGLMGTIGDIKEVGLWGKVYIMFLLALNLWLVIDSPAWGIPFFIVTTFIINRLEAK